MTKTPGQVALDAYNLCFDGCGVIKDVPKALGDVAAAVIAAAKPQIEREALLNYKGSKCAATVPSFEPMDCNAPFCGCDPVMAHTIDDLINCGWKSAEEVKQIEAEARASMVEQAKQALQVVLRNEVMSKHTSLKDCQSARSGIVKSIAAIEALAAVPPTHQVVPVEPTEAMINAAFDATVWPDLNRATTSDVIKSLRLNMAKEYKAMLAASKVEA